MRVQTVFLGLHLAALLAACTNFTLFTLAFGGRIRWDFYNYAYANGWGLPPYQSDYSLGVVLTYLIAYGLGVAAYASETRWMLAARTALAISLLGMGSFLIELSHWFFDHQLCLIASFPSLLLLIGGWRLLVDLIGRPCAVRG